MSHLLPLPQELWYLRGLQALLDRLLLLVHLHPLVRLVLESPVARLGLLLPSHQLVPGFPEALLLPELRPDPEFPVVPAIRWLQLLL